MRRMGIEAIYRRPNTSKPAPGHRIYPYLLRGLTIDSAEPCLGGEPLSTSKSICTPMTASARHGNRSAATTQDDLTAALDGRTPDQAYFDPLPLHTAA